MKMKLIYFKYMFKDGNIPDNQCYRDHYIRTTGAHTRYVTAPYSDITAWESRAIGHHVIKDSKGIKFLLEELKNKFN